MAESERRPPPVDEGREAIVASLGDAEGAFVGLDFDGTLSPIASSPDEPAMTDACRAAVQSLADLDGVTVGVVSGRALDDLRSRVDLDGVVYAGNHGLELEHDGEEHVHPAAEKRRPLVRDVRAELEDRLADVPGCLVEDKDLTLTVHYRQTPADAVEEVREAVRAAVPEDDADLRVSEGKEILEVKPAIDWDKGSAMLYVAEHLDAENRLVYVGDDVTDEDVFEVLGEDDVGVHVGSSDESLADYRLDSQGEVAGFLSWLADAIGDERASERA